MNTQTLYMEDPTTLEFEVQVIELQTLPDGRVGALLDRTYFYPTGGGQEHDTGEIAGVRVLEVYKEGEPARLVHVLEREIPTGPARARIDRERRLRHMQHHTAQHLLTQCFLRLFGLETVSANINGITPTTLDLPTPSLPEGALQQAEGLANEMIYANLPVRWYFVAPQELDRLPLRKPPKVQENIRVVEIEGFDWTPCGGTHCDRTGVIGVVKIVKSERVNEKTRVHFVAGLQALEYFRLLHELVTETAVSMSLHPRDLPAAVRRQGEALRAAERELQGLRALKLQNEARDLYEKGERMGERRAIQAAYPGRAAQELRALGDELRKLPGAVAALAGYEGGKLALVAACAPDSHVNARDLLLKITAPLGLRGGGDATLAQGGGPVDAAQFEGFEALASACIRELANQRKPDTSVN